MHIPCGSDSRRLIRPLRSCGGLSNYPKTGCNPRKIQDLRAFSDSYLLMRLDL